MAFRVFVRGVVGKDNRSFYDRSWADCQREDVFERVRRRTKQPPPFWKHCDSIGFSVLYVSHRSWLSFLERRFLPKIRPLFYYVWGKDHPYNSCIFPFYLAALNFCRKSPLLHMNDLVSVFTEELDITPEPIIEMLIEKHLLYGESGGSVFVAPMSSRLVPGSLLRQRNQANVLKKAMEKWLEEGQVPADVGVGVRLTEIGIDESHSWEISSLLAYTSKIRARSYDSQSFTSIRYCIEFEKETMPLVHKMLNHCMYNEARSFLQQLRRVVLGREIASHEENEYRKQFFSQAKWTIGAPMAEICGRGNSNCFGAMLPFTVDFIESHALYRREENKGLYQLYDQAKLPDVNAKEGAS